MPRTRKPRLSPRDVGRSFARFLAEVPRHRLPAARAACARFLARARMLHAASSVLEALDEALLARESFRRAAVTSADPLEASEVRVLEGVLGEIAGGPVRARVTVRPRLLAGFCAEIGDLFVDASLRGQLRRLRSRFRDAFELEEGPHG